MDYASGIAGGVLGYIHGNTRGAIKGYRAGKQLYQNKYMAAPKRKRSTQARKYVKRGRGPRPGTKTVSSRAAVGTSRAVVRSVGRKARGVVIKRKKVVKVTKAFRDKVAKATEPQRSWGYRQEIDYRLFTNPSSNTQNTTYSIGGAAAGMFSPLRVAHVAAVLFNGKTDTLTPTTGQPGDFPENAVKIEVKKQWVNYELKNNSRREMTVKIFECAPNGNKVTLNPHGLWSNGLALDDATKQEVDGTNLNSIGLSHVGLVPHANKMFRKQFKVYERTLTMEAGQTHKWTVNGPSMTYDMAKYFDDSAGAITELHGMTRWCLITYYPSVCVQDGRPGRYIDSNDLNLNQQHGLVLEHSQSFVIAAPKISGYKADGGTLLPYQTMDSKKDVYSYVNWVDQSGDDTLGVHMVNELQPMDGT